MFNEIKQIFITENGKVRKRILLATTTASIGTIFLIWYIYRVFICDGELNFNNHIDLTKSGLIGNCISGVTGTFFSLVGIIVLFETLSLQRKEFEENRKIIKYEIFDNTFFNLLKLYQEVMNSIQSEDYNSNRENNIVIGKKYFEFKKNEFSTHFENTENYDLNRQECRKHFNKFYDNNQYELSLYFRTIYRIYKFIDESTLSELEKNKYSKIVRAQFSDSEIFFIYYNSFSKNGKNFRALIYKYNITKHLRIFEKIEFKYYLKIIENFTEIENILIELKSMIKDCINLKTNKKNRIKDFRLEVKHINELCICLQIVYLVKPEVNKDKISKSFPLLNMLIQDFLFDYLVYSNYYKSNNYDLKIESQQLTNYDKYTLNYELYKTNSSINI